MATFTVTNLSDSGAGSLRDAILQANLTKGLDEITFDSLLTGGTINLTSGQLQITKALNINGLGANQLTVDAGGLSGVFEIEASFDSLGTSFDTSITGLKISGGDDTGIRFRVGNGTLNLRDSIISGNSGVYGGGIFTGETTNLNISDSIISGNSSGIGAGGGIFSRSNRTNITNTNIFENSGTHGGGIFTGFSTDIFVTLTNSNISKNYASESGGGILSGGNLSINNSTLSENYAKLGGGISQNSYFGDLIGKLDITDSTISGNSANYGGGIFKNIASDLNVNNSNISGNFATYGTDIYNHGTEPVPEGDTIFGAALALAVLGHISYRQHRRKHKKHLSHHSSID
jgi:hypothetical protein